MATYYALTTTNPHSDDGYSLLAIGSNKAKVEDAAIERLRPFYDIYSQTMRKNLQVVSRTYLKRTLHFSDDKIFQMQYDAELVV